MTVTDVIEIQRKKPQMAVLLSELGLDKTCVLSYLGKCKVRSILRNFVFDGINEVMNDHGEYSIYGCGLITLETVTEILFVDDLEFCFDDLLLYVGKI